MDISIAWHPRHMLIDLSNDQRGIVDRSAGDIDADPQTHEPMLIRRRKLNQRHIHLVIFAPKEIVGIAYDSGGVTTSTVTVPLVTALGVGLASTIRGRNPLVDGFGLIAFASLLPMIFVIGYGIIVFR